MVRRGSGDDETEGRNNTDYSPTSTKCKFRIKTPVQLLPKVKIMSIIKIQSHVREPTITLGLGTLAVAVIKRDPLTHDFCALLKY
jgi:hypothetical protein